MRLGLNFDQAGANSAMTHVLVLSDLNERLWLTVDIASMFGQMMV